MAITFYPLPVNRPAAYDARMNEQHTSDEQNFQAQLHLKLSPPSRPPLQSRTDRHAAQIEALRRLYPRLTDKELVRARDNLERYLILSLRIFDRIQAERESMSLTSKNENFTMHSQRSNPS